MPAAGNSHFLEIAIAASQRAQLECFRIGTVTVRLRRRRFGFAQTVRIFAEVPGVK